MEKKEFEEKYLGKYCFPKYTTIEDLPRYFEEILEWTTTIRNTGIQKVLLTRRECHIDYVLTRCIIIPKKNAKSILEIAKNNKNLAYELIKSYE